MPSLEAVCESFLGTPLGVESCVGGALSFIPILNLFSLGYLLEYTIRLRREKKWDLPEWNDVEPLHFSRVDYKIFLLLAYAGIPILWVG